MATGEPPKAAFDSVLISVFIEYILTGKEAQTTAIARS